MLVDENHMGGITQGLILYGLGSHTMLLPAPRQRTPGDFVVFWWEEARSCLTAPPSRGGDARAFSAPAETWGFSFSASAPTGGCLPPQAGHGGGEEFTQYRIYFQCLMGLRMGANCAGSSNTHTHHQRVFQPGHSLSGIVAPPEPFWELLPQIHGWECTQQSGTHHC